MATARISNYLYFNTNICANIISTKGFKSIGDKLNPNIINTTVGTISALPPKPPPIPNFDVVSNKHFIKHEMSESHSPRPFIRNLRINPIKKL